MNGIGTEYGEPGGRKVARNDWESILGRLNAVADEINRALGWVTSTEEPGSGTGIVRTPYTICQLEQETIIADIEDYFGVKSNVKITI